MPEQLFLIKTPPSPFDLSASKSHFWHSVQIFFRALAQCCLDKHLMHACEWTDNNWISWMCKGGAAAAGKGVGPSTFPHYMWRHDPSSYQETSLQPDWHQPLHSTSLGSLHLTGGQLAGAILQSHPGHEPSQFCSRKQKPRCSVEETSALHKPPLAQHSRAE